MLISSENTSALTTLPEIAHPDPIRIGIVGYGKMGLVHSRNLEQMSGVEVTCIAEPNFTSRGDIAEDVRTFSDWQEVVSDTMVDAVAITLPHSMHAECAKQALASNKHVFLEKPLATTLRDAQDLVDLAREKNRLLMVNMTHRFYPPVRTARRMLQEGLLGSIVTIHDHYMEVIDRTEFPKWFFDPVLAGGGVTVTDSIHLVDRVSWLLGETLELKGQVSRTLDPESRVEDCSELICQSESGVAVTVGSFFCFDKAKTLGDRLTIFGTRGTLVVHAWSHIEWTPHGEPTQKIEGYASVSSKEARSAVGHRAAMEEFLSAIREDRTPEASGAAVLHCHEVVQRFYDNLKS